MTAIYADRPYEPDLDLASFVERCLVPFPEHTVGSLPRVTCGDCSKGSCQRHHKAWCDTCNQTISTQHIHLSYVGHAEVTARLLHLDPLWTYEPVAFNEQGLPAMNLRGDTAELWIRLTVRGVTRYGVGTCKANKSDVVKELIGDAIRNAAMRFGIALNLWAKDELDGAFDEPPTPVPATAATGVGVAVTSVTYVNPQPGVPWWQAAGWASEEAHGQRRQTLLRRLMDLPPEHQRTAKRYLAEQSTYAVFDQNGERAVAIWIPQKDGKPDGPGLLAAGLSREAMDHADAYVEEMTSTAALEAAGEEPFEVPDPPAPAVAEAAAFAAAHGGDLDPEGPTADELLAKGTATGVADATKGKVVRRAKVLAHANHWLGHDYQSLDELADDVPAAIRYYEHLNTIPEPGGIG